MSSTRYSSPETSLEKRLLAYSAAAGLAVALAPSADAQVMYTDVDPDVVIDSDTPDADIFEIDFDNDGVVDITLAQLTGTVAATGDRPIAFVDEGGTGTAFKGYAGPYFNYLSVINEGDTIDEGDTPFVNNDFSVLGSTYGPYGPYGPWAGDGETDKYIGVRFQAGGGTSHYAWVLLDVAPNSESITLKGYAFEATPNTPIIAGATGVATEPGALADGYLFSEVAPNPIASGRASFDLAVGKAETVSVEVYDTVGRRVMTAFNGAMVPGATESVSLDTSDLPAGVYVVRVSGESFVSTRNVTVVR